MKQYSFTGIANMTTGQLNNMLGLAKEIAQSRDLSVYSNKLVNQVIATMFYEPSTRTRGSFTMAAYRLGANVLDITPRNSSLEKGETLVDTFLSLQAMKTDLFVIRHSADKIISQLAKQFNTPLVNAGDGMNEHPSQTLLDLLTISLHRGDIRNLKIVLVGDILHSRVATSFVYAMSKLGYGEFCLVGPPELLPDEFAQSGVQIERDMNKAVTNADVIMMLRIQSERIELFKRQEGILNNHEDYFNLYGLSSQRLALAKKDALVMHPGPLNRGVEISSEVADSSNSLILKQVEYGVYARMAIFLSLLDKQYTEQVWEAGEA